MGKSNDIAQQEQLNAAFQEYINKQTVALDAMIKTAQSDITTMVDQHYKTANITDANPLTYGTYEHLTTVSEWNVNSVSVAMTAISNAIFGKAPLPDKDKDKVSVNTSTAGDLIKNATSMEILTLLISTAAFNAVNGVLNTIDFTTSTSIQKQSATKVLAPGLTLFLCIIDNQYSKAEYLKGNTIVQTGYVFDSRYSVTEANRIGKFNLVQSLINEMSTMTELASKLSDAISNLDPTSDAYDAEYSKLTGRQDTLNKRAADLQKKTNELAANSVTTH